MLREGRRHGFRILLFDFDQHHIPRLTFDKGRNIAVMGAGKKVVFPMPGYCAIFDGGGPVLNRDGIRDCPQSLSLQTRMFRVANSLLGYQAGLQLLFKDASGLNIQAAIDGFVGHAGFFSFRMVSLQPPGDLLGGPLPLQLSRDDLR